MTQDFISYIRKDLAFVVCLAKDLKVAGLEVWYDLSGLEIGAHWGMEIQTAIQQSHYFIIVLSPNSIASEWVEKEFIQLLRFSLFPLLPVVFNGLPSATRTNRLERILSVPVRLPAPVSQVKVSAQKSADDLRYNPLASPILNHKSSI